MGAEQVGAIQLMGPPPTGIRFAVNGALRDPMPPMKSTETPETEWVEALVRFLKAQPGVNAVRVDPEAHRIAVATIGRETQADLEERLAETIATVEAGLSEAHGGNAPR